MKTAVRKLESFFDGTFDEDYVSPFKSSFMEQLNALERMIIRRIGKDKKKIPFSFWDHYDDTLVVIDKSLWGMAEAYNKSTFPDIPPRRQVFLKNYITKEQDTKLLTLLDVWYLDIDIKLKKLGV